MQEGPVFLKPISYTNLVETPKHRISEEEKQFREGLVFLASSWTGLASPWTGLGESLDRSSTPGQPLDRSGEVWPGLDRFGQDQIETCFGIYINLMRYGSVFTQFKLKSASLCLAKHQKLHETQKHTLLHEI